MILTLEHGVVTRRYFARKSYRKARWLRSLERLLVNALNDDPDYSGVIVLL